MVASDITRLVSDGANYFDRATDWSWRGGHYILDTYCTRNQFYLRLKATKFHLQRDGSLRRNLAAKCQMPPSNFAMPRPSDSIANCKGASGTYDAAR